MKRRSVLLLGAATGLLAGWRRADDWRVDRAASSIDMTVSAVGRTRRGRFADWSGTIGFDPDAPARTRATITVQAASLNLAPAFARDRATGPAFLDAARYPAIRFELLALRPLGGERYEAEAEVTMKDRTRPIAFPVDLRVTGDRAHLTGAFSLDRTDYGIGTSGPWNRMVGRLVTVQVALQARRA